MEQIVIRCEQCEASVVLPRDSSCNAKESLAERGWERYGARISVGAATSEHDGRYSCPRCARELNEQRFRRVVDSVLQDLELEVTYHITYPDCRATLKVLECGWELPLEMHHRDSETYTALRRAISSLV